MYDSKSETYSPPTMHPARGQAVRSFADAVNQEQGVIAQHPQDFTLFELGEFDQSTGEILLADAKVSVVNGLDLKIEETNVEPLRA